MGVIIGVWLFMLVSSFCALAAVQYFRLSVRDFGSMVWAVFVIMFVWTMSNVLGFVLMAALFGD